MILLKTVHVMLQHDYNKCCIAMALLLTSNLKTNQINARAYCTPQNAHRNAIMQPWHKSMFSHDDVQLATHHRNNNSAHNTYAPRIMVDGAHSDQTLTAECIVRSVRCTTGSQSPLNKNICSLDMKYNIHNISIRQPYKRCPCDDYPAVLNTRIIGFLMASCRIQLFGTHLQ